MILISAAAGVFALAPDGRRLAFYDDDALVLAGVDGGSRRVLATGGLAVVARPGWSPDGRVVSFVRGGLFAPNNLWLVDLATGAERQVTHFTHSIEGIDTHAWLPDGRHIVVSYVPFSRQQAPHDLGILDVDDGSIQRLTITVGDTLTLPSLSADGSRMLKSGGSRSARTPTPTAGPRFA